MHNCCLQEGSIEVGNDTTNSSKQYISECTYIYVGVYSVFVCTYVLYCIVLYVYMNIEELCVCVCVCV